MSLFLRLRHHLPQGGFCSKSIRSPLIAFSSIKSTSFTRNFSQPATQVKEEEEEIEIDQRRLPTDYDPATFDPTEHRSPPTDRVWRLVDEMSSLTLAEVAELSSIMMKKMGMEPPVIAVMKGGAAGLAGAGGKGQGGAKEEAKPEKSVFELKLDSFEAASKIKIIKEVRSYNPEKHACILFDASTLYAEYLFSMTRGKIFILKSLEQLSASVFFHSMLALLVLVEASPSSRIFHKAAIRRCATLVSFIALASSCETIVKVAFEELSSKYFVTSADNFIFIASCSSTDQITHEPMKATVASHRTDECWRQQLL
ncbi:ribosomal protein L7/L12, oligomerization [Artemisia annua]|uniref:Ribosomal protein L7/L12, oligomerization n=1 Tax=Artemisia annua TaxID=35608 RepID=A0A2U1NJ20_ARTAN|nr:ribosomal protein L7/L12, oligomerization [Artemisia annua]